MIHPLAPLARELSVHSARYLLIGVSGANFYGPAGQAVFATHDFDLFLPPDPDNLVLVWKSCEQAALTVWLGDSRTPIGAARNPETYYSSLGDSSETHRQAICSSATDANAEAESLISGMMRSSKPVTPERSSE